MGDEILVLFTKHYVDVTKSARKMVRKNIVAKCFAPGSRRSEKTLKMNAAQVEIFRASVADSLLNLSPKEKNTWRKSRCSWHSLQSSEEKRNAVFYKVTSSNARPSALQ